MGTVARSIMFQSDQTTPLDSILIDSGGKNCELLDLEADSANLMPGLLAYTTANNVPNEVTEAGAAAGNTSQSIQLFVIEFNNSSVTVLRDGSELTTAQADRAPLKGYRLKPGMQFWAKGSTLTATLGEMLICAASGLVTNVGDPDGTAVDEICHGFMALAPISAGTWIPVEYLGKVAHDKTA